MCKHEKFDLPSITLIFTKDDEKENSYIIEPMYYDSPLTYAGSAQDCARMFACWLENSLNMMERNHCSEIRITASNVKD